MGSLLFPLSGALAHASAASIDGAGVRDGVELTRSGSITVDKDGTVIEAKDVDGFIRIRAHNVTIRDTRITNPSRHGIQISSGYTGTVVENTEITCVGRIRKSAIAYGNYTARDVTSDQCPRGFLTDSRTVISNSWVDGTLYTGEGSTNSPEDATTTTAAPTTTTAPPETTTTTAAPTTTAPSPASNGGAYPDADSTGVPAGTQLRPSGSITVTQDGAVIEDLEVTGRIIVDAQNVTIRRVLVYATGSQGIYVRNGSATIEDVDVVGRNECAVGIGYGNYTARRVDIRGCQDGAKIGNNTVLVDSYIHDLLKIAGSHNDGIQCTGNCKNVRILHNTIRGPHQASTASVKFSTNTGPITDVLIKDNYLAGGNYTIYFDDKNKGYGPATHFHVVDNVIEANSYKWGWRTGDHHHTQTWSNNVIR